MYGYAFSNSNTVIIAFVGTFYRYQWELDMENKLVPLELNGHYAGVKIHQGFFKFIMDSKIKSKF